MENILFLNKNIHWERMLNYFTKFSYINWCSAYEIGIRMLFSLKYKYTKPCFSSSLFLLSVTDMSLHDTQTHFAISFYHTTLDVLRVLSLKLGYDRKYLYSTVVGLRATVCTTIDNLHLRNLLLFSITRRARKVGHQSELYISMLFIMSISIKENSS